LRLSKRLALEIDQFLDNLVQKADELKDVVKLGRTQLQDALPTTVGNTFQAFASAIARNLNELNHSRDALKTLNLGGTAIGTTVNASEYYVRRIVPEVSKQFGRLLYQADNLIDATQHVDAFIQLSHAYKLLAVTLSKMASDLRLLSSGPQFGFNELFLPKKQAGSSIMPGKVNPVIPELVNQVAFQVIGFDTTNTLAAEAGQLELNAFEPIIVRNLITASRLLQKTLRTFRINCISGIQANSAQCAKEANQCAILATALTPYIGYSKTCKLVKQSLEMDIPIQTLAAQLPDVPDSVIKLLDPKTMIPFYKTQELKAN